MEWTSSRGVTWSHFHANDAYVSRRGAPPRTAGSAADRAATGRSRHYHAAQWPARGKHLALGAIGARTIISVGAARCRVTRDGGGSRQRRCMARQTGMTGAPLMLLRPLALLRWVIPTSRRRRREARVYLLLIVWRRPNAAAAAAETPPRNGVVN